MTTAKSSDSEHMSQALALAARGLFTTDPNPRVGCVVVKDNHVVGQGWHCRAGEAHAEVMALGDAGTEARGATVYVTLEPCCHHGQTPPCSEALVAAGVEAVVFAMEDPNPRVQGKGVAELRAQGIGVRQGPLQAEALALNRGFVSRMTRKRPYLTAKLAVSLDGKTALASGESQWITGEAARADVHRQRAQSSVILTASGTVLADNPRLTARLGDPGEPILQPQVVMVDSELRVPPTAKIFDRGAPVVFTCSTDTQAWEAIRQAGGQVEAQSGRQVDLLALVERLAELGHNEIWVEAGAGLNGALLSAGLVDEFMLYYAPVLLGSDSRGMFDFSLHDMAARYELELVEHVQIGTDLRIRALPRRVT
jgi:diaminohydroxyphosphoribosylaminopyrimidine deaminase/5-amino-6-(5-phosphoribosylamino)uracil reductase